MRKKKCLCIYAACGLFFLCILIISFSVDTQAAIDSSQADADISIDEDLDTDYFPEPYWVTHEAITITNANDTANTHLPIDITAIGRGEQVDIMLSLRFFDLDLFSANSRRINEAMIEQIRLNREAIGSELFESFEMVRVVDINEQVAIAATSMGLFTEPVSFGRVGQVEAEDEIPLWVIIAVLPICAILGFVIARTVISKKEG